DVDRDEGEGHRPPPTARRPQPAATLGRAAARLPGTDALRALEPDRGRDHALRADRPAAPRAGDAGRAVRVPVAGGGRRGRLGLAQLRCTSTDWRTTSSTGRSLR